MNESKIDFKEILDFGLTLGKYMCLFVLAFLWIGIGLIGGFGEGMFLGSLFDD